MKSCYIHIPFCKNICSYCDFCKNYYNEKIVLEYLDALEKEVKENYKKEKLKTIYIGGGTPSSLTKKALDKLFKITNNFLLEEIYEFTFECNYEDITDELLSTLKQNKVNRISVGFQTFNERFSHILERKINKRKMIENVNLAKKYFDNINIDLMYAIGNETMDELKGDIEEFIKLDVPHISTYALILEEHTKLKAKSYKELSDDLQSKMYYMIVDKLKENNYIHYEISNFSKKGYESKHNLTYWNNKLYYGFGAGASGFIDNTRYDNTKSIFNYIKDKKRVYEEELSINDLMKDEVMLNLRKTSGINKVDFNDKYNKCVNEAFDYSTLKEKGFLEENEENIYIKEEYLFVSNEIILMFMDNYLN